MVINSYGVPEINSTGFTPDKEQNMPDYEEALNNDAHCADWCGRLSSGEKVMALTKVITDNNSQPVGAIRYIVSLEEADRKIFVAISFVCLAGIHIF